MVALPNMGTATASDRRTEVKVNSKDDDRDQWYETKTNQRGNTDEAASEKSSRGTRLTLDKSTRQEKVRFNTSKYGADNSYYQTKSQYELIYFGGEII